MRDQPSDSNWLQDALSKATAHKTQEYVFYRLGTSTVGQQNDCIQTTNSYKLNY
jgi:hypothetical protein